MRAASPATRRSTPALVVTDPSQAAAGSENWSLLVNMPARPERVPRAYVEVVLAALRRRGVDLGREPASWRC